MIHQLIDLWLRGWRSLVEILLLWVAIYYGYLYFRGTRGAKVLTGLAIVFLTLTLISTLANLVVIGWIIRSCDVVWPRSADIQFSRLPVRDERPFMIWQKR